jgi:hypothetical protein
MAANSMQEHPGDTLGTRFLTFWGAFGAIAAVAVLLAVYRWLALPSDGAASDGGAGAARAEIAKSVVTDQNKEYSTAAEVEAGTTVRLPADVIVGYAAGVLKSQKPSPGPLKTPEATAKEAATTHDPNLSKFEGK